MERTIMDFNTSKVIVPCSWCGKLIERYRSQLRVSKHSYCSSACRSASISKRTNPNGYTRHAHLSEYNQENNGSRMTPQVRDKLRKSRLGKGKQKSYPKIYGRHVHRQVAEKMLGRALLPGEVVHHIDGDKQNFSPSNLQVLSSQAEHARLHALMKRGDAT